MEQLRNEPGPVPSPVQPPVYVPPKRAKRTGLKRDGIGSVFATIAILLLAPLTALLLTSFVFQSYQVDGASMQTTLHHNDRLIVWKVPRTWARITKHAYVPNRGDVVVFSETILSSIGQQPTKQLIKRVIGLPGERVVVKDGGVRVYNAEHPEGIQPDKSLPYGNVIPATSGDVDMVVPSGSVFVLGDNRPDSLDSRTFGTVPSKDIIGKLLVRVWPAKDIKLF